MSGKRGRVALGVTLALGFGALATATGAQAAKVKEKAQGGPIPPRVGVSPVVSTAFVQEFKLKGKKVRNREIVDVEVTVNATGSSADSNRELSALLVSPKSGAVGLPIPNIGSAMENLRFDHQSFLRPCNPYELVREDCNYLTGADVAGTVGTMIGEVGASLNSVFRGGNPKGTWRLYWWDNNDNSVLTALGETTLKVKTAKRN